MRDIEFCNQILDLDEGWSVSEIDIDEPSNRIDITVSFGESNKRGLFFRQRKDDSPTVTLRHLPFAGKRCFLHVPEPSPENGFESWNYANSKLTRKMEDLVVNSLKTAKEYAGCQ